MKAKRRDVEVRMAAIVIESITSWERDTVLLIRSQLLCVSVCVNAFVHGGVESAIDC